MRIARIVIVLIALAASVAYSDVASACSLALRAEAERFSEAKAAFVGTAVSSRPVDGSSFVTYVFRVDEVHKGELGETIELQADSGVTPVAGGFAMSSCGLTFQMGAQRAMYLSRGDDGTWGTSLAQLTTPEQLRAVPAPRAKIAARKRAAAKRRAAARRRAAAKRRAGRRPQTARVGDRA